MGKVREVQASGVPGDTKILFECPGCGYAHVVDKRWFFNGNFEKPTFKPSVLVNKDEPNRRCHSFVLAGKIKFLKDCHHELAGKIVNLPDLDSDEWDD